MSSDSVPASTQQRSEIISASSSHVKPFSNAACVVGQNDMMAVFLGMKHSCVDMLRENRAGND